MRLPAPQLWVVVLSRGVGVIAATVRDGTSTFREILIKEKQIYIMASISLFVVVNLRDN